VYIAISHLQKMRYSSFFVHLIHPFSCLSVLLLRHYQNNQLAFDKTYGGTWHCIVGRNFGCSVTHETKYLVFFKVRARIRITYSKMNDGYFRARSSCLYLFFIFILFFHNLYCMCAPVHFLELAYILGRDASHSHSLREFFC